MRVEGRRGGGGEEEEGQVEGEEVCVRGWLDACARHRLVVLSADAHNHNPSC